jgi:hypothetical protein
MDYEEKFYEAYELMRNEFKESGIDPDKLDRLIFLMTGRKVKMRLRPPA